MNKKVRKNFSASFKKKVALEALEEQETLSSLYPEQSQILDCHLQEVPRIHHPVQLQDQLSLY